MLKCLKINTEIQIKAVVRKLKVNSEGVRVQIQGKRMHLT